MDSFNSLVAMNPLITHRLRFLKGNEVKGVKGTFYSILDRLLGDSGDANIKIISRNHYA